MRGCSLGRALKRTEGGREKGRSLALAARGLWSANCITVLPFRGRRMACASYLCIKWSLAVGCPGGGAVASGARPPSSGAVSSPKRRVAVSHSSQGSQSRAGGGIRWHHEGFPQAGQQHLPQTPPHNLLVPCLPTGEHRLDPDAYLLDLYRANPHGEWVIKKSPT